MFAAVTVQVADRFTRSRRRLPRQKYEMPSAGFAFLRLTGGIIELARLGDCKVLIETGDRLHAFVRSDLDRLDGAVVDKMRGLRRGGLHRLADVRNRIIWAMS
jgi:hypothetical protein